MEHQIAVRWVFVSFQEHKAEKRCGMDRVIAGELVLRRWSVVRCDKSNVDVVTMELWTRLNIHNLNPKSQCP